jgi:hypothetical protein
MIAENVLTFRNRRHAGQRNRDWRHAAAYLVIDGPAVGIRRHDGSVARPRVGVNPIALDYGGEWLYVGTMHGLSM